MADLKLARLPDRTPVKMALSLSPELHDALCAYGRLYAARYGREEQLADLVPSMLAAFLESDREFAKSQRAPATTRS